MSKDENFEDIIEESIKLREEARQLRLLKKLRTEQLRQERLRTKEIRKQTGEILKQIEKVRRK
jgi:hypothetical protein